MPPRITGIYSEVLYQQIKFLVIREIRGDMKDVFASTYHENLHGFSLSTD